MWDRSRDPLSLEGIPAPVSVQGVQVCIAAPDSLHECRGFKFKSSCLADWASPASCVLYQHHLSLADSSARLVFMPLMFCVVQALSWVSMCLSLAMLHADILRHQALQKNHQQVDIGRLNSILHFRHRLALWTWVNQVVLLNQFPQVHWTAELTLEVALGFGHIQQVRSSER